MSKTRILHRMLGVATLAMMFGTSAVLAQSASSSSDTSGASGKSSTERSSGTGGGAAGAPAVGSTTGGDTSGASGASGASGSSAASSEPSSGASASSSKSASGQTVNKQDRKMMQDLAHANASEIAAGKLALEKSQNDQVKQYAQKLIDDHTQAQQELQKIADAKGVELENEPDAKHKSMVKTMSALEGEKFDKMYLTQGGARDHKNTQQLLQKMQKQSKDKDLQALAQKIEPAVQQHLTMAQDLQSGKSSASGASGATGGGTSVGASGRASGGTSGSSSGTSGGSTDGAGTSGSSGGGMSGGSSSSSGSSK